MTKVIEESSFEELDRIYLTNRVLALVGDGVLEVEIDQDDLIELKRSACRGRPFDWKQLKIVRLRVRFSVLTSWTLVTPCPSQVNRDFWDTYAQSPEQAIADFYQLSQKNDLHQTEGYRKEYCLSCTI